MPEGKLGDTVTVSVWESVALDLLVNIHSRHISLPIALNMAQKFPAVAFVKSGVVGQEVNGGDSLGFQVFHGHGQQVACNALATVGFICVNGADVGGEVFSIMKIVFNDTETADDPVAVGAEIPTVFGFAAQVCLHAGQIGIGRDAPFFMKPFCRSVQPFGAFA